MYSLVAATSMCPAIFFKICRHWVTKLSFTRSGERSKKYIDIISVAFSTVGGK